MAGWWAALRRNRKVAHLLRAVERYQSRLGSQFAAAITYFSVLAMVPILMFAFSLLGLTVVVLDPTLIARATAMLQHQLGSAETAEQATRVITSTLASWREVGTIAVIPAAYAGAGWVGNIKRAVDAMWRDSFDITGERPNIIVDTVRNLVILVGLVLLGAVTMVISVGFTAAKNLLLRLLGWTDPVLASWTTTAVGMLVSLLVGWLLFVYLYTVLPAIRRSFRAVSRGALFGSLGLILLQYGAGLLIPVFSRNRAIVIFGPVIVAILSLNLFAVLVMLGAAWTATSERELPCIEQDPGETDAVLIPVAERPELDPVVTSRTAQRGVRVGLGVGYLVGGATGLGLGALLVKALTALRRRA
ncbi:MAG: YihY/virulence factor BrkB family protein [Actinomycetia bacterium]|nr:YihY/virulence factor BrkB family protein [Actinomycetes bacterium]